MLFQDRVAAAGLARAHGPAVEDFGARAPWGVLLLHMGGPESLQGVEEYLRALFADRDMIRMPFGGLWQERIAGLLARRRAPVVRQRYAAIGGGSPVAEITRRQGRALERELGWPVGIGFRYTRPRTDEAVKELLSRGARRLLVLPLYPQFSFCTTGSALADLERCASGLPMSIVRDHHDDAGYIHTVAENLRHTLGDWCSGGPCRILFVAHSLPLRYVRRGDPYVDQTRRSAQLVSDAACLPDGGWHLAFSSRVGPVRWQGPTLAQTVARLRRERVRRLVAVPLSFAAENLETLWDLDIDLRRKCAESGIMDFRRVPAPGDSPRYLEALGRMARRAAAEVSDG